LLVGSILAKAFQESLNSKRFLLIKLLVFCRYPLYDRQILFQVYRSALRDKVLNWSLRHLLQCSASISFNRGQARSHPPAGEQKRALCNEHQTDPQPRTNTGNPHEIHIKNPEYDADNDRTNP
jgi:hypothetical protein